MNCKFSVSICRGDIYDARAGLINQTPTSLQ